MKHLLFAGPVILFIAAHAEIVSRQQLIRLQEAQENADYNQFNLGIGTELPKGGKIPVIAEPPTLALKAMQLKISAETIQEAAEKHLRINGLDPDTSWRELGYYLQIFTSISPSGNPEKVGYYDVGCEVIFVRDVLYIVDGELYKLGATTYRTYGSGEFKYTDDAERTLMDAVRSGIDKMSLAIYKSHNSQ